MKEFTSSVAPNKSSIVDAEPDEPDEPDEPGGRVPSLVADGSVVWIWADWGAARPTLVIEEVDQLKSNKTLHMFHQFHNQTN